MANIQEAKSGGLYIKQAWERVGKPKLLAYIQRFSNWVFTPQVIGGKEDNFEQGMWLSQED